MSKDERDSYLERSVVEVGKAILSGSCVKKGLSKRQMSVVQEGTLRQSVTNLTSSRNLGSAPKSLGMRPLLPAASCSDFEHILLIGAVSSKIHASETGAFSSDYYPNKTHKGDLGDPYRKIGLEH